MAVLRDIPVLSPGARDCVTSCGKWDFADAKSEGSWDGGVTLDCWALWVQYTHKGP